MFPWIHASIKGILKISLDRADVDNFTQWIYIASGFQINYNPISAFKASYLKLQTSTVRKTTTCQSVNSDA